MRMPPHRFNNEDWWWRAARVDDGAHYEMALWDVRSCQAERVAGTRRDAAPCKYI